MARASATNFIIQPGEHALISGKNGSGKTGFITWYVVRIPTTPIVIYDTKLEPKFDALPNNTVVHDIPAMEEAAKDEKIDYIIVRPPEEMLGTPEQLDDFLWAQYLHMHNTVAVLDEGATFVARSGYPYKGLLSLMQRGRSKGISVIIGTQRPVNIARPVITEVSRAYLFYMQDLRDRQVIDNLIPGYSKLPLPKKYAFYYWESGLDTAILYEPVRLDPAFDLGYTDASNGGDTGNVADTDDQPAENPTKHVWV